MSEKSVFINNMTGGISLGNFFSYMLLALVGALIVLLWNTSKRDPLDKRTPLCFSISFFIRDNLVRLVLSFLLVWVTIIFSEQMLGVKVNAWIALGIGAGHDQLAKLILKNFQSNVPKTKTDTEPDTK